MDAAAFDGAASAVNDDTDGVLLIIHGCGNFIIQAQIVQGRTDRGRVFLNLGRGCQNNCI